MGLSSVGGVDKCQRKEMVREAEQLLQLVGLLKVRVRKGVALAIRDKFKRSSDPYVIVKMGNQKLKTPAVKRSLDPEWNVDLTLTVSEHIHPIRLEVYDKDTFSHDDPMGNAEIDIQPFMEAVNSHVQNLPDDTIISSVMPNRKNCLAEESVIRWSNGRVVQEIVVRLRNVECGEIELQLQWERVNSVRGIHSAGTIRRQP